MSCISSIASRRNIQGRSPLIAHGVWIECLPRYLASLPVCTALSGRRTRRKGSRWSKWKLLVCICQLRKHSWLHLSQPVPSHGGRSRDIPQLKTYSIGLLKRKILTWEERLGRRDREKKEEILIDRVPMIVLEAMLARASFYRIRKG